MKTPLWQWLVLGGVAVIVLASAVLFVIYDSSSRKQVAQNVHAVSTAELHKQQAGASTPAMSGETARVTRIEPEPKPADNSVPPLAKESQAKADSTKASASSVSAQGSSNSTHILGAQTNQNMSASSETHSPTPEQIAAARTPITKTNTASAPTPANLSSADEKPKQIGQGTIRIGKPKDGWPKGGSIKLSLITHTYSATESPASFRLGSTNEIQNVLTAVSISRSLNEQLGMTATAKMDNFDVVTRSTSTGKQGSVACGIFRKNVSGKQLVVGAVFQYFFLSDWCDKDGNVVIDVDPKYFSGGGDAQIWLCDADDKAVMTERLSIK